MKYLSLKFEFHASLQEKRIFDHIDVSLIQIDAFFDPKQWIQHWSNIS